MMLVEISKRADGAGVLRCTRRDGSVTWQKQKNRKGFWPFENAGVSCSGSGPTCLTEAHWLCSINSETGIGLRHKSGEG